MKFIASAGLLLALGLFAIHPALFAADREASGIWSGFYMSLPPDTDQNPFQVELSRSGGGYRATVSSEEEGWRTEAEQAGFEDGLFTVSFPFSLPQAFGDHPPARVLLRGVMLNGVWSGTFTMHVAEHTLETGFTLHREGGGGGQAAQGSGGLDIWGTGDDSRDDVPPSTGGMSGDPGLAGERPVWLRDPVVGAVFAMVVVPDGWMASGRVQWNFLNRSNPAPITLLFTHPATGRSLGIAANLGAFSWSQEKERIFKIRDGTLMTDTGVFNLRYRNAEALLREFLVPAVGRAAPGGAVVSIAGSPQASVNPAATGAGQLANIYRRAGKQVSGPEVTQAEMVIEYAGSGGTVMRDVVAVSVSAISHSAMGGTVEWDWDTLVITSAPKGMGVTDREVAALTGTIRFNPQWERERDALITNLRQQGVAASIEGQKRASAFMKQRMERYSMEAERFRRVRLRGEDQFIDPRSGEAFDVPFSKYAVRDTINDRIIYSDSELNPNLMGTGVVPLVRRD